MCSDRVVGQLLDEGRLPVVLQAGRYERVEGAVESGVRHDAHVLGHGRGDVTEPLDDPFALGDRPGPARHQGDEGLTDPVLRHERQRRCDLEGREAAVLPRGVGDEVPEVSEERGCVGELEEHRAAVDVTHRVQPEGELGDHAEVPAATAKRPEQVWVLPLARGDDGAVGRDDLRGQQVVAGQAVAAAQVADAAAQGQPGDAGRRDDPAGGRQPVHSRGLVEATPGGPAAGTCRAGIRVDHDAVHQAEVGDDGPVRGAEAGHAVATPAHRQGRP